MRIDIVARPEAPHQVEAAQALAEGLERHGVEHRIVARGDLANADTVACWGWRNGERHAARGACVLVIEAGYVGDRAEWLSLGWNGLNGRAQFPVVEDGGARWRAHFDGMMKRRRRARDGYTLVLGQVQGDAALRGLDIRQWYSLAARVLPGAKRFRMHPVEAGRHGHPRGGVMHGMPLITGALEEAFKGASFAAAYNSNALVDAALAGIPVLACDKGSMAWPVAGHGLDAAPVLGDREPWAHRLAWCQWRLEEIARGAAWDVLSGEAAAWS